MAERVTTAQAAELRNVTPGRIWALYKAGRLKGKKTGPILTFAKADVLALVAKPVGRPRRQKGD